MKSIFLIIMYHPDSLNMYRFFLGVLYSDIYGKMYNLNQTILELNVLEVKLLTEIHVILHIFLLV